MLVEWAEGLAMNTFLAQTLCESTITEDRSRFEMTFVDAGGPVSYTHLTLPTIYSV